MKFAFARMLFDAAFTCHKLPYKCSYLFKRTYQVGGPK